MAMAKSNKGQMKKKTTSKPVLLGGTPKKAAMARKREKIRAQNKADAEAGRRRVKPKGVGNANTPGFAFGRKTI